MRDNRRNRSHTKKGPGRYSGRGKMVTVRPMFTDIRIVKDPQQRLAPALVGGNWKGLEYLSYAEHDQITRTCAFIYASGGRAYEMTKAALIDARSKARAEAAA